MKAVFVFVLGIGASLLAADTPSASDKDLKARVEELQKEVRRLEGVAEYYDKLTRSRGIHQMEVDGVRLSLLLKVPAMSPRQLMLDESAPPPKAGSTDPTQQKLKELAQKNEKQRRENDDLQRKIAEPQQKDVYQMRVQGVRYSMLLAMPRSSAQPLVSDSKEAKPTAQEEKTSPDRAINRKRPGVEFERVR